MQVIRKGYFQDISRVDLLSQDDERVLIEKASNGDEEAQKRLVEANLRYVFTVARKYENQGLPKEDLIQAGNIGLIKASKKIRADKNVRFITYAGWWINAEIQEALWKTGKSVRLPVHNYEEFYNPKWNFDSVDRTVTNSHGSSCSLGSLLPDQETNNPEIILIDNDEQTSFMRAINNLTEVEQKIILGYFGVNCERKTLSELGDELGYSKQGISYIQKRALKKLKEDLKDFYEDNNEVPAA